MNNHQHNKFNHSSDSKYNILIQTMRDTVNSITKALDNAFEIADPMDNIQHQIDKVSHKNIKYNVKIK